MRDTDGIEKADALEQHEKNIHEHMTSFKGAN